MTNELKKGYIYYIIGVLVFILVGALSIIYMIINNGKFKLESESEIIYKNNYKIEINYPVFNNKKVNNEIQQIIKDEKKLFLDTIDEDANYENELNINYSYGVKDTIYSVHIRTYSYTGEEDKYYRNDKLYYFDSENNKELKINDLINDDKFYEILKDECYNYINNQDSFDLYDEVQLDDALKIDNNNYKLIVFSENKILIIFAPHTISPYDGEINISIQYDKVKEYLNTDYFNLLVTNKDKVTQIQNEDKDDKKEEFQRIRDFKEFEGKKVVALTFDDGPAYSKTETLLEEFSKRDVRVSFFVLGSLALKQPDLIRKAYEQGHTIGSHTYDHKSLKKLNDEQLNYEINYTNEILKDALGIDIQFMRPPYGAYNQSVLDKVNMSFILWNKDSEDWKLRNADKLADYLVNNMEDGDIVLMHDIHQETIDGVIKALDMLKDQGYVFVSLEELFAYRKIQATGHTAYRSLKVIVPEETDVNSENDNTIIEEVNE